MRGDRQKVKWKGLIRSFNIEGVGEYKVVREAEGIAPWGSRIKAEQHKSEEDCSILLSLPEQRGRLLAVLNGLLWEIWVTPKNEIHVVRAGAWYPPGVMYPPDEYLWLTGS
ncbi:MAG: hypothetical protein QXD04_03320 [Candidatus Bathyarchaeia archaeon]